MTAAPGWTWPTARIVEIHDGDTIKLDVDCGFGVHSYTWIRLLDVRAPELSEDDGIRALNDVTIWLAEHAPDRLVAVTTYRTSQPLEVRFRQTFTRYLGTVTSRASPPADLNQWLREQGWTDRGQ